MFECPLCRLKFDASARVCDPCCPLKSTCHLMCCPRCGYRVVDLGRSSSTRFLQRAARRYSGCLVNAAGANLSQN